MSIHTYHTHPFSPVFDKHSKVLILGSFPSMISRDEGFYYAHSRNRFWQILSYLFESDITKGSVESKKQFLLTHHIALWDIVSECSIAHSSDASLKCAKFNDLDVILSQADIGAIFCNGRKAYTLFTDFASMQPHFCIQSFLLPSSSPANARYSLEKLLCEWEIVRDYVKA